jgi:hypothetical protein
MCEHLVAELDGDRYPHTILDSIVSRHITARLRARKDIICTKRIRGRRERDGDYSCSEGF